MTAKEKAQDLFVFFFETIDDNINKQAATNIAKNYARICIQEITEALTDYGKETDELQNMDRTFAYWDKVKQEIKTL